MSAFETTTNDDGWLDAERALAEGDPATIRALIERGAEPPSSRARGLVFAKALRALGRAAGAYEREVASVARAAWARRRTREVHPEGSFDGAGRWYPSDREDCGDVQQVRSPSRAWPYSYMSRCRTREHCRALVDAALAGSDVPPDVAAVVRTAREVAAGAVPTASDVTS